MNRSVIVYSVLLVAALVASYLSWTADSETTSATGTTVDRFQPDDIESITWETDQKKLVLHVREDDRGRYVWVDATEKAGGSSAAKGDSDRTEARPQSTDAGPTQKSGSAAADAERTRGENEPDAGPSTDPASADGPSGPDADRRQGDEPDEPAGEHESDSTSEESYLASSAVEQIFEKLNPLRARRELTVEGENDRKMYGFDDVRGTLTIRSGGEARTLTVGGYAYGRRHLYLRDDQNKRYYVVDTGLISPLRFAETRLKQKRAVEVDQRKIDHVRVEHEGESVKLVQHNSDDPSASYWSMADTPEDKRSRTADSWIGKLLRLQIKRYVTGPRPSGLEQTGVISVSSQSEPDLTLKLFERAADGGAEYYARSEFTRKLVELERSSASTLVADIDTLLEGGTGAESSGKPSPTPKKSRPPRPPGSRKSPKGRPPGGPSRGRGTGRAPSPPTGK